MHVTVCVMHMCMQVHVPMSPGRPEEDMECLVLSFWSFPLKQGHGVSLNLRLGWQPASPSHFASVLIRAGVKGPAKDVEDLNSGPHA